MEARERLERMEASLRRLEDGNNPTKVLRNDQEVELTDFPSKGANNEVSSQ